MAALAPKRDFAPDEFLAWEARQPEKWEFVGGVVRMIAGGTRAHDRIANNIRAALWARLRGGGCDVHGPDLKVRNPAGETAYPDVLVRCGPGDDGVVVVEDPVLLFEVLSEGTATHDLTRKRRAYKAIPTARVIVYVAQDEARLDVLRRRPDGSWDEDGEVEGLDASLDLPEIGMHLPMAEIYEGTDVARAAAEAATAVSS
jgi:Uma2 family endonuclease